MAISEVDICNSALAKIGVQRIDSFTEVSKAAQHCVALYDTLRDDVLVNHFWNFAMDRVALAQLVSVPLFGFTYQYQLPTDCLRVKEVYPSDVVFEIEGKYLLTNESSVSINFIKRITDTNFFSANFIEALAYRLAKDLAYPLVNSLTLMERMDARYKEQIKLAKSNDAQEGTPRAIYKDVWLRARK